MWARIFWWRWGGSTEEAHRISGLEHGEHTLREVEAPEGFELAEDLIFTVTDANETLSLTLVNVRMLTERPLTGLSAMGVWLGVGLVLLGSGGIYVAKKRKNKVS